MEYITFHKGQGNKIPRGEQLVSTTELVQKELKCSLHLFLQGSGWDFRAEERESLQEALAAAEKAAVKAFAESSFVQKRRRIMEEKYGTEDEEYEEDRTPDHRLPPAPAPAVFLEYNFPPPPPPAGPAPVFAPPPPEPAPAPAPAPVPAAAPAPADPEPASWFEATAVPPTYIKEEEEEEEEENSSPLPPLKKSKN